MDFSATTRQITYQLGSDGNLAAEWAMMELLHADSVSTGNFELFACTYSHFACLDMAAASTLSLQPDGSDGLSSSLSADEFGFADVSTRLSNASAFNLFGGIDQCDGKRLGDGAINSYDFAVMIWSIFKQPPYDAIQVGVPLSQVPTASPRHDIQTRCGTGITRGDWQLRINAEPDGYCEPDLSLRRLSEGELAIPQSKSMEARIGRWAFGAALGVWYKVHVPGLQLVVELLIDGLFLPDGARLSNETPPSFNCTDCLPLYGDYDKVQVSFGRRAHDGGDPDYGCANIVPAHHPSNALEGNVLNLRQSPPTKACLFDSYIWVPHTLPPGARTTRAASEIGQCEGVGIGRGSSALNGHDGVVQINTVCAHPDLLYTDLPITPKAVEWEKGTLGWKWWFILLLLIIPAAMAGCCCLCRKRTKSAVPWKPDARSELPGGFAPGLLKSRSSVESIAFASAGGASRAYNFDQAINRDNSTAHTSYVRPPPPPPSRPSAPTPSRPPPRPPPVFADVVAPLKEMDSDRSDQDAGTAPRHNMRDLSIVSVSSFSGSPLHLNDVHLDGDEARSSRANARWKIVHNDVHGQPDSPIRKLASHVGRFQAAIAASRPVRHSKLEAYPPDGQSYTSWLSGGKAADRDEDSELRA
jgi:hypothetical protein